MTKKFHKPRDGTHSFPIVESQNVAAGVSQDTSQPMPNGNTTKVDWDTTEIEHADLFSVDLPNGEIEVLEAGTYTIRGAITFNSFSTTDTAFEINLYINGSEDKRMDSSGTISTQRTFGVPLPPISTSLNAGDTLDIRVIQANANSADESTRGDSSRSFWYVTRNG